MSSPTFPDAPIRGASASPGLGEGRIAIVAEPASAAEAAAIGHLTTQEMFDRARAGLRAEAERAAGEVAQILRGQLALLDDPNLARTVEEERAAGRSLAEAVDAAAARLRDGLLASDVERIRQRASDVDDLAARLQTAATGRARSPVVPDGPGPFVLVARDLLPSQTAQLDADRVTGLVLEDGGPTAHAAIIARALAIPLVTGVTDARELLAAHSSALVDGTHGGVWPEPDDQVRDRLTAAQPAAPAEAAQPVRRVELGGGEVVEVAVNIGAVAEAERASKAGARAVGLLRSELLAFAGARSREELAGVLRQVGQAIDGPIVFRLLDVGGDKPLDGVTVEGEPNPMLGARGVRLLDTSEQVFVEQLAAVAAVLDEVDVRISVPMVADPAEVVAVRELWSRVSDQPAPPIGIMVETPAAVFLAEPLAAVSDFFSIGTNDLTQYVLAADRGNPAVAHMVDATHPAVLGAIGHVTRAAQAANIPVAVCGQAAADPVAQRLLVGLGVTELSVPVDALQATVAALRGVAIEELREEASRATGAHETPEPASHEGREDTGDAEPGRFVVTNPDGLHVRPASQLADVANEHGVRIVIRTATGEGDASSVFSILALGIDTGHEVEVDVEGDAADMAWPSVRAILAGDTP
ncbi:HPr family phosphocarrier protein [Egicoccus sp. AB-alg2]|uniref:HPr family phosphocarrier protein n=1 Tax=Egicoccus sp. AB-alg2 TaxID=3242693 RepID=UPI00359DB120